MVKNYQEPVNVFVVGDARIVTTVGVIDPSSEILFALALYLSLECQRAIGRRSLEKLMWPSAKTEVAAHRLRQTLFKLRRQGFPLRVEGRNNVYIPKDEIVVDYLCAGSRPLGSDISEGHARVLPGFEPNFSAAYAHWLDNRRAEIIALIVLELLKQISEARKDGRWPTVEAKARQLLKHAPENEEAILALSEALAMRGEKIGAVRVLDSYLTDVGDASSDLRLPAMLLKRRIGEQPEAIDREARTESPIVGRERFSSALAELLEKAKRKRPAVVSISGQPGIGKSRLLSDFLSFASLQGATCHKVTCRSTDSSRPLAVLLELIPLLRNTRGAIGCAPETLEFFDVLVTHRPKTAPESRAANRAIEIGTGSLDVALLDIVDAVTDESTMVVAIEDYQWIDVPSAVALTRVCEKLTNQRLLVIITTRGLPVSVLPELKRLPTSMELPPLGRDASEELLRTIVASRGALLSAEYAQWCSNVAEGNPYFLHELANHWLDTRQEHVVPPSLTSVLNQRLSRLPENALQVLQTCAVLENHATIDNLEDVLGLPAHELMQSIDDLANAGMITTSPNGGGAFVGGLISRHDLLSDVALSRLSAPAGQYLHRRAARSLEKLIAQSGDASTLWSCAKHWQLAGDNSQALRLANSCARHLLDAGLSTDAAEAFSKAQRYCVTDTDMLQNLEGQAISFYRSSDWRRANETIDSIRRLKAKLRSSGTPHDDLELMQLRADWQTMNWKGILARSLDCLNATAASQRHRIEGGVMALMMLSLASDPEQAITVSSAIESLPIEDANLDVLLQSRMIFHTNWGSFSAATEAATGLLVLHRQGGEVGTLFRSLCNAAVTFRAAGHFDHSRKALLEAIEVAERHNVQLSKVRAVPMLANLALELGDVDEARKWLHELSRCAVGKDDVLANAELSAISARIALLDNNWDLAQVHVERDLGYMLNDQVAHRRAYASALRVAVQLGLARRAEPQALKDLESAHLLSRANVFQAFPTFALYAGLLSVGKKSKADRLMHEYVSVYRREPTDPPMHLLRPIMACVDVPRRRRPGRIRKKVAD